MAPAQVAALAPAASALAPAATPPPAETPKREPERDLIAEAIRGTVQDENATAPTASLGRTPPTVTANASPPASPTPPARPPVVHTGWMIQVGAFDVEQEARQRLSVVQTKVGHLLKHASPFTEVVTSGDKTLYRARIAGIQKDEAEAICKQLKRTDIACMMLKN
jgi:D-alanyl-D-alanine carboxypeptidase